MRRFFFGLAVFALAAPMPLLAETTDRQIAQQIVKQLKSQKDSGELKGFNLDLQVEDGAVYLKGFVSEREQRRKAVEVARQVDGVTQVFNEIEIKPSSTNETLKPVRETSTSPARETRRNTTTSTRSIDIDASADSDDASSDIGHLLQGVVTEVPANVFRAPRPIQVDGEQAIKPTAEQSTRTAREITESIVDDYRSAMESGELKGFGIDVQVDQGVVWLKGTVADPAQLDYAIEVARSTAGVTKVVDELEVTSGYETQVVSHDGSDEGVQHAFRQESNSGAADPQTERIAKEVVAGLQKQKQEGLLTNFGIDVQVDQRVVWMSGYVKDAEQHTRALNVARYVPGVEKVVNDLKVQGQGTPLRPVTATMPAQPVMNYQMAPVQYMPVQAAQANHQTPMAFGPAARPVNHTMMQPGQPVPMTGNAGVGIAPARFDHPQMPGYAWPSYASAPNYGAVTYPKQYSPSAWPYIGPFYPYPQVPLGWRRVTLEWDDGWWNLKFKNTRMH